jgi:hypothetical protein
MRHDPRRCPEETGMPKLRKTSAHMSAVGAWGKETALRLLNRPGSGFTGAAIHDGYVLATGDGRKYLFSVAARDRLQEDGVTPNPSFNVFPDEAMPAARAAGAIPAWLVIPIDRKKDTFSAFWGLMTKLPPGRTSRYAVGVPMKYTSSYACLARDEADPHIKDIFVGKR